MMMNAVAEKYPFSINEEFCICGGPGADDGIAPPAADYGPRPSPLRPAPPAAGPGGAAPSVPDRPEETP